MTVRVLWFASLADRTGVREETVDCGDRTTVEALWDLLQERHPRLREMGKLPVPACDGRRVSWSRILVGVREVVFLPPVSGG